MNHDAIFNISRILVLMPVYNGENFLCQQVDSILAQSHKNLQLVCRDDQSTDTSLQILQTYVTRYPGQVRLLQDSKGNLGASGSFSELMQWALSNSGNEAPVYVALADQDDIWRLDKLQRCLQAMIETEHNSPGMPVLVHSDLRVVDAGGEEIASSFVQYQGLDPTRTKFSAQLISNTVTGCTSLMNMALLKKALPVPPQAVMHDWWLSLVASAFGSLVFVPQALVEYRQHERNTLGAREHKGASFNWQSLAKIFQYKKSADVQKLFEHAAVQADVFAARFGNELNNKNRSSIRDVMLMPQQGLWHQRLSFRRMRMKR